MLKLGITSSVISQRVTRSISPISATRALNSSSATFSTEKRFRPAATYFTSTGTLAPRSIRSSTSHTLLTRRYLHRTAVRSSFFTNWLSRGSGMRSRIGAWADSLGVSSGHARRNDGARTPEEARQGEELFVMPGWAVIKHREGEVSKDGSPGMSDHLPYQVVTDSIAPFDLHVSVSGFCSEARSPTAVSRTQRVIVSVVKRKPRYLWL